MKTKGVLAVAILVAVAFAGNALARDLPRFDVESHCQEVAEFGGGSNMVFNGCIDMEQAAYHNLKATWSSVPATTQAHCTEVASFGGESYSTLSGCIDMEVAAGSNRSTFSFE
ncbi:hypothetical protein GCM10027040_23660 [Halomonas shantousis]